ncbi:MAG: invasion associated locus B family protein [Kiloniellaceae bacterium]
MPLKSDFVQFPRETRSRAGARRQTAAGLAAAGLAVALATGGLAAPAAAQTQVQPQAQAAPQEQTAPAKVFGDWAQRCTPKPPPGASPPRDGELESCFIVQQFVDPSSQRPVLKITIGFFEPGRRPAAVLALPLGVPLARGAHVSVDGNDIDTVPFQICRRDGCQAFLPLTDDMVKSMKAGSKGQVTVQSSQGEGLNLPFSLKGFTAGYGSIQ